MKLLRLNSKNKLIPLILLVIFSFSILLSSCDVVADVVFPTLPPLPTVPTLPGIPPSSEDINATVTPTPLDETGESSNDDDSTTRTPTENATLEILEPSVTVISIEDDEDDEQTKAEKSVIIRLPVISGGQVEDPPTVTPTPTSTPTLIPTPFAFSVQQGNPIMIPSFTHPNCDWMGIVGQVFDGEGVILNLVVKVNGTLNGVAIDLSSVTGTATSYGSGGYEIKLSDELIVSSETLYAQLFDPNGAPLSTKVFFNTSNSCEQASVLINFVREP